MIESEIGDLSEFGIDMSKFMSIDELKKALANTNLGKEHMLEEVQEELGDEFNLTKAEIYSVGPWREIHRAGNSY